MIFMNYSFTLDSYAWVEYVIGSEMGKFVEFILKRATCFTPSIVISELSDKFHRENNLDDWFLLLKFIKHKSKIINLTENIADESGKCKGLLRKSQKSGNKKIGLADAIIYQTALYQESKLITGDEHFESREEVVYLKRVNQLARIKQALS